MNNAEFKELKGLCQALRALPGELKAALGDAPPIGHHLYSVIDFDSFEPESEVAWAKFVAANYSQLPREKATWEVWERWSDSRAYNRFFGTCNPENLKVVIDYMKRAQAICDAYSKLEVPEDLWWNFDCSLGFSSHVSTCGTISADMLGYISFRDPSEVSYDLGLVIWEDAGIPTGDVDDVQFEFRQWDIAPDGKHRINLRVIANDDFSDAFEKAIEELLPWETQIRINEYQCRPDIPTQPIPPEVQCVTITKGREGFQFHAPRQDVLYIPLDHHDLISAFVTQVQRRSSGEVLPWQVLNACVYSNSTDTASNRLRKNLNLLRKLLKEWGRTPDGDDWIVTERQSRGAHLNRSCRWEIDNRTIKYSVRRSQSVFGLSTDAQKMAENTQDGNRLTGSKTSRSRKPLAGDEVDNA